MRMNIEIDQKLLNQAKLLSGFESSPSGGPRAADTVNASLWASGSASCLARPPRAALQTATSAVKARIEYLFRHNEN